MNTRRTGAIATITIAAVLSVAPVSATPPVVDGQSNSSSGHLQQRIGKLERAVRILTAELRSEKAARIDADNALRSDLNVVESNSVLALDGKLTYVDSDLPTAVFSGVNVQVVNGLSMTESTNELGNLIVGYNASGYNTPGPRTGSHNVVIGDEHGYPSFGGFVAGFGNLISGKWASVSGGQFGGAYADYSSVSGGYQSEALGMYSSVCGGFENLATGHGSSACGGIANKAEGTWASVSGGEGNRATGDRASISGGDRNTASGNSSSILGGSGLTAPANGQTIPALP